MDDLYNIKIEDYSYDLADTRIARYPLPVRDSSKLLYYRSGKISSREFKELPSLLPDKSLLIFNETKVIQARLVFRKETGARIEVFCLEPVGPVTDFQLAFGHPSPVVWKCLVGNAKRWKSGTLEKVLSLNGNKVVLRADWEERLADTALIRFSWVPADLSFSEIIEMSGLTPLPPYLHREAEAEDKARYQTVYAQYDGSVAAPTAGLHFTENILGQMQQQDISMAKVTLHVGAGTFRPVIASAIADHEMHGEKIVVHIKTLQALLDHIPDPVIPVGTTSMRTLESLFWIALKLRTAGSGRVVGQWDPYRLEVPAGFDAREALSLLIRELGRSGEEELKAETRLMIAPGYQFRLCSGIITNFHQPKSTLLLLVAALIGEDWRRAYEYALRHDFRFLSYGDSCLFLP